MGETLYFVVTTSSKQALMCSLHVLGLRYDWPKDMSGGYLYDMLL